MSMIENMETYDSFYRRNHLFRIPVIGEIAVQHNTAVMLLVKEARPVTIFSAEGPRTYQTRAEFVEDYAAFRHTVTQNGPR